MWGKGDEEKKRECCQLEEVDLPFFIYDNWLSVLYIYEDNNYFNDITYWLWFMYIFM